METPSANSIKNRSGVCFSFAAYAKNLINYLKACKIRIIDGLSDAEFDSIEAYFGFVFPPDLRSILQEGLPVGTGFPNWRSSSPQQLKILLDLPISVICSEISNRNLWCRSWDAKPENAQEAVSLAKKSLKKSPVLIPIHRHCYIPSKPNLAGNPVFYVRGGDFRYSGFDIAGFFQQEEFLPENGISRPPTPAWAAKSARRITFWSALVEGREVTWEGKDNTCGDEKAMCGDEKAMCGKRGWLDKCLEETGRRLREGGWKEEDVKEMTEDAGKETRVKLTDKESVVWHVRLLSLALRKAGWSADDVLDSLGLVLNRGPQK